MKKACIVFLCCMVVLLPLGSSLAQAPAETGLPEFRNILMVVSLDKKVPQDGKTFAMGCYYIVLDEDSRVMKFVSFPYNLALTVQSDQGEASKQLQAVGKELGPDGLVEVLEANFGIAIDRWLMITMTGLADFVDVAGGIEVDLPDLSINQKASDLKYMMDKAWVMVEAPGLQIINGVQAMAYISDTYTNQPTISEEELIFRERQEVLIRGIIKGLGTVKIDVESLATLIVDSFLGSYSTNVSIGDMVALGRSDLAESAQYEQRFLFIPQEIFTVKASNGWESLGFSQEDVAAVQAFTEN